MSTAETEVAETGEHDTETDGDGFEIVTPVVVEMGKLSSKKLKAFKKGEGPLVDEVIGVLGEVVDGIAGETEGRTLVPVVMVYEKKPKKNRRITLPF